MAFITTKKAISLRDSFFKDAVGGSRTHTVLPPLDFESSASANSATTACILMLFFHIKQLYKNTKN